MSFLRFWGEAISQSFGVGWIVLGGISTAMPVVFHFIGKYWPASLEVSWLKWCVDHQNELHVAVAAAFVVIYLCYAPFQLYSREHSARVEAERKVANEPRIKLDVADTEVREELRQTKEQLSAANKEMEKLRGRVEDRSISPDNKEKLLEALKSAPKGKVIVKADWTDNEAQQFAGEIKELLSQAGFSILNANTEVLALTSGKGTFVCVTNAAAPPVHAGSILNAFKVAGIFAEGATAPPNMQKLRNYDIPSPRNLSDDEVIIWVARKP